MYTAPSENIFISGHFPIAISVEDGNPKVQFVGEKLTRLGK